MKSTNILLIAVSVLVISLTSCKPKEVVSDKQEEAEQVVQEVINATVMDTEDCKYDLIEGEGKITRMNFSNPDNVVIQFEFTPPKSTGLMPTQGHIFNVNGVGKYPSRSWCEKNGIEQGATFRVNMYQLSANSDREYCQKMVFSFVEFEDNGWR